jgi:hypothetical protein
MKVYTSMYMYVPSFNSTGQNMDHFALEAPGCVVLYVGSVYLQQECNAPTIEKPTTYNIERFCFRYQRDEISMAITLFMTFHIKGL